MIGAEEVCEAPNGALCKEWRPEMKLVTAFAILAAMPLAAGCATPGDKTAIGTLLGAAVGAGTGAIVGNQSGHAGTGVAIGAGLGALAGAMIGNAFDNVDEQLEESEARNAEILREIDAKGSLSILDVIRMSQAGLSDNLIIAKIDQSGSRFDLSPQDMIDLKRSGVSERVIEHMIRGATVYRTTTYSRPAETYERTTYVVSRPLPVRLHTGFVYYR
jgi:hypothetical protein